MLYELPRLLEGGLVVKGWGAPAAPVWGGPEDRLNTFPLLPLGGFLTNMTLSITRPVLLA